MKVLVLVLTYLDNDIFSKFYKKQNETWNSIDVDDVDVYFNINGGDKKEIKSHFIINDLPEKVDTEYAKIINCFEQTINWDYDYIFHTNSSSYVDKSLLYKWLLDKPRNGFYSGVIGGYKEHTFASGCGFTISKDVVKLIIENQNNWGRGHELAYAVGDDVTLGILLYNLGINPYPAPRFDITDSTYIPSDFFHYRCKTDNREFDVNNMDKIFISKYNNL